MKLFVVGDVHWSTYSSILRTRGVKCSTRLDRLVKSINWAEEEAINKGCDSILYLGDFFDKPELNSEEISMLEEIKWNELPHYFIVGNHESDVASLEYNSTNVLRKHGFNIVSVPTIVDNLVMLPYITEDNRKNLKEYLGNSSMPIVFSHNDIKNVRYGMYLSKTGFDLEEIEQLTSMYINGHLHNGAWVNSKKTILNLGNLCGQNFSEDAFNYSHRGMILDTTTLAYEFEENPYALNFYKIDIDTKNDMQILDKIKDNAVICVKCNNNLKDEVKQHLDNNSKVVVYKLVIYVEASKDDSQEVEKVELKGLDYMEKFKEFIIENMGQDAIVLEEIGEVCK